MMEGGMRETLFNKSVMAAPHLQHGLPKSLGHSFLLPTEFAPSVHEHQVNCCLQIAPRCVPYPQLYVSWGTPRAICCTDLLNAVSNEEGNCPSGHKYNEKGNGPQDRTLRNPVADRTRIRKSIAVINMLDSP